MRLCLSNWLRQLAEAIESSDEIQMMEDQTVAAYGRVIPEIVKHMEIVEKGEASIHEFAHCYALTSDVPPSQIEPVKEENIGDKLLHDVTWKEFATFWRAQEGWETRLDSSIRKCESDASIYISILGTVGVDDSDFDDDYTIDLNLFDTLNKALEAANELAGTKAFGGWA